MTQNERLATFVEAVAAYSCALGQVMLDQKGLDEVDIAAYVKTISYAALAYARPIVTEECAKIVLGLQVPVGPEGDLVRNIARTARACANENLDLAAAAIREHGRKA